MRARASMSCSSAPSAASRRSCCRVNRSATASYRSSRSIAAPGGATRAGCGSRPTCGAMWGGCCGRSGPRSSSGLVATRPGRSCCARSAPGLDPDRPTVFAFGGSQGAQTLNYAVAAALERRLLGANVLWGTGAAHAAALARYAVPERVVVRGFFDSMTEPYRAADVVVSRAGAMTVAELCAWGKPSILVPLPTAAANHQTHNARALAAAGAALFLAEHDLTAHALARLIGELLGDPARLASLAARARARGHPNASREIVSRILTLVPR